eukprot:scaffold156_cov173-Ochromonas_danica.AAC.15
MHVAHAWRFPTVNNPIHHALNQIKTGKTALIAASALLVGLEGGCLLSSSMVMATDAVPIVVVSQPVKDQIPTSSGDSETARVLRKISLQKEKGGNEGEESYLDTLKREKGKQDVMRKKSKSERSKDMCEALGRGC